MLTLHSVFVGQWLDKQKVALRCPKALDDSPATRKVGVFHICIQIRTNYLL